MGGWVGEKSRSRGQVASERRQGESHHFVDFEARLVPLQLYSPSDQSICGGMMAPGRRPVTATEGPLTWDVAAGVPLGDSTRVAGLTFLPGPSVETRTHRCGR